MTAMFVFASIPMLDRRSTERRPEFAAYAARTPALVPRPPRRP
jgi:steroid 5-alpha reductase family enzyme